MVSIRRRKLLSTCDEQKFFRKESSTEETRSLSLNAPSPCDFKLKEEATSGNGLCSSNVIASSSSKEKVVQQVSEVKRRRQHRLKHIENQEPCIMRGVYFKNLKWQAAIKVDKKQIHLGTVRSQEEAARLYDRAAFMCGREPNFQLSKEEKQELSKFSWDEFLAMTRLAISSKRSQRRRVKKLNDSNWEGNKENDACLSPSDDEANDMVAAC